MKALSFITAAILGASFLFCSCGNDYVLNIYGSVSGQVTDYVTGNPLSNAQVTLLPGKDSFQTGVDGSFFFSGLDAGQYTVSVQKDGYQRNVKYVTVVSGETVAIVVPLTAIPQ